MPSQRGPIHPLSGFVGITNWLPSERVAGFSRDRRPISLESSPDYKGSLPVDARRCFGSDAEGRGCHRPAIAKTPIDTFRLVAIEGVRADTPLCRHRRRPWAGDNQCHRCASHGPHNLFRRLAGRCCGREQAGDRGPGPRCLTGFVLPQGLRRSLVSLRNDLTPSGARPLPRDAPARSCHSRGELHTPECQCSMLPSVRQPVSMRSLQQRRPLDDASAGYPGEPECPSAAMFSWCSYRPVKKSDAPSRLESRVAFGHR